MKMPDTWRQAYLENAIDRTKSAILEEQSREVQFAEEFSASPAETRVLAMTRSRRALLDSRLRRYQARLEILRRKSGCNDSSPLR